MVIYPTPDYAAPQTPDYAAPQTPDYAAPQTPDYTAPQTPDYTAPQTWGPGQTLYHQNSLPVSLPYMEWCVSQHEPTYPTWSGA